MKKTFRKDRIGTLLEFVLNEDNPAPQPQNMEDFAPPETPLNASLDQVVDRYIVRYEKESIPVADTYENEMYAESKKRKKSSTHFSNIINEAFLSEAPPAPEDEDAGIDLSAEAPPPDADPGADAGAPPPDSGAPPAGGSGAVDKPIMATPQINLQDFARNVARLVNNFDALLKPKNIILNRVKEYIKVNYDPKTAEELMDILSKNYSLNTLEQMEQQGDEFPTPYAAGALSSEG